MTYRANICWLTLTAISALGVAADPPPPSQRLLTGADAKLAEDLDERLQKLIGAAKFAEALKLAEELHQLRVRVQGREHWETATSKWDAATLRTVAALPAELQQKWLDVQKEEDKSVEHYDAGRYAEAEACERRILAVRLQILGEEHPDTAQSYNHLGLAVSQQGKHATADPLLRKAIDIKRRTLGTEHPDVAEVLCSLGANLQSQGEHVVAEPLLREALAIYLKTRGEDHADTSVAYNNVASMLQDQGKFVAAEPLFRKSFAISRKLVGDDDPSTADSANNLATNLDSQGKHAAAEPLFRLALAIRQKVLGPDHPNLGQSYSNIGSVLKAQGKHSAAEPLFRQALALSEKTLGPDHPESTVLRSNVASCLDVLNQRAKAEPLHRQVLAAWEKQYGPDHAGTAIGCTKLAANLYAQGQNTAAEALYRRALATQEKSLGAEHPATATTGGELATVLHAQGKFVEAEALHAQTLRIQQKLLGLQHPQTADALQRQALFVLALGKNDAAAELHQQAARSFEAARLAATTAGLDRSFFAAARSSPYPALAAARIKHNEPERAWQALEAYLGRGLLDALNAGKVPTLTAEERAVQTRHQQRIQELTPQLLALGSRRELGIEQRRQLDELIVQRVQVEDVQAELAVRVAERDLAPLAAVQAQLAPDAALLAWLDVTLNASGLNEHWACVVKKTGPPIWIPLPGTGPNATWTRQDAELRIGFLRALRRDAASDQSAFRSLQDRLYAQRLAPVEPQLQGIRRLVVLPAGFMSMIPLETLTDKYTINYAPSATVSTRLAAARQAEPARSLRDASLLALGDPVYSPGTAAPTAERAGQLQPLPGTRREVEAIRSLFTKSEILLGSAASEQNLVRHARSGELKRHRVIHLATHGQVNTQDALRCSLILALDALPELLQQVDLQRQYDGRLEAGEILEEWTLDADLVTLSACESGLGQPAGGEGLMGFAQVLLFKGARSVLLSQWQVSDTATSLLMVRFYENWLGSHSGKPMSKAEALKEAKHWLRNLTRKDVEERIANLPEAARGLQLAPAAKPQAAGERPFAHPYYWSAFILIGDSD